MRGGGNDEQVHFLIYCKIWLAIIISKNMMTKLLCTLHLVVVFWLFIQVIHYGAQFYAETDVELQQGCVQDDC